MQNIHFKVAANGSIRRFELPDANYSKLVDRVKILFGFDVSALFTMQWKDKEGNQTPVSSDEDLTNLAKKSGSLIHLTVQNSKPEREKKGKRERCQSNPEKYIVCLRRKQRKLTERLSVVPLDTKKRLHLQKKLADINDKIGALSHSKPDVKEAAEEIPSTPANQTTTPLPVSTAPGKLELGVPPPPKAALKEASRKYFLLKKDVKEEKLKIKNLKTVLSAVKLLYRTDLGDTACRIVVGIEDVNKTKLDLDLACTHMIEKRQLAKDQALVMRNLAHLSRQMHDKPGREQRKDKIEKKAQKGKEGKEGKEAPKGKEGKERKEE